MLLRNLMNLEQAIFLLKRSKPIFKSEFALQKGLHLISKFDKLIAVKSTALHRILVLSQLYLEILHLLIFLLYARFQLIDSLAVVVEQDFF